MPLDISERYPSFSVENWQQAVANDETRLGYWEWVEDLADRAGPTYDVWIAEPDNWEWQSCGMTFTCSDDPNGDGARQHAHDHARYLRNTYPCAFVAVRAATKGLPLPVRLPL